MHFTCSNKVSRWCFYFVGLEQPSEVPHQINPSGEHRHGKSWTVNVTVNVT
jgi:hypothetical protein